MADTATTRLRLKRIGTGDYLNTWGSEQNVSQMDLIDEAIGGFASVAVAGNVTLTSVNYATDQARRAALKFTGAGGFNVTVPAVEKVYLIHNTCTAAVNVKTAAGASAAIDPGEIVSVYCDGTDCYRTRMLNAGGQRIKNLADPTSAQDAATRAYVLAQVAAVAQSAWAYKSANYTAVPGDRLICNTNPTGAFTVTLPASPANGSVVEFMDYSNSWRPSQPLTIARNGAHIMSVAEDLICDQPGARLCLVYLSAAGSWGGGG